MQVLPAAGSKQKVAAAVSWQVEVCSLGSGRKEQKGIAGRQGTRVGQVSLEGVPVVVEQNRKSSPMAVGRRWESCKSRSQQQGSLSFPINWGGEGSWQVAGGRWQAGSLRESPVLRTREEAKRPNEPQRE